MQMQEKGYKDVTLEQIVNKMKKLRQKYKTEKDKTRKSGNGKKRSGNTLTRLTTLCPKNIMSHQLP